jgi:hypothetical protein
MRAMVPGIAARIRAQTAAWRLAASQSEREARAMEAARQLDADEVGRRADRRRQEREAHATADSPATDATGGEISNR